MIPFSPHQTHLPRHVFHILIRHEIVFPRSLSAKVIVSLVSLPVDYFFTVWGDVLTLLCLSGSF